MYVDNNLKRETGLASAPLGPGLSGNESVDHVSSQSTGPHGRHAESS